VEGCPTYKVHDLNSLGQPVSRYYSSNSAIPLTEDGKTVRYVFVSEYYDTLATSFKTEYLFTTGLGAAQKFAGAKTGAPSVSYSWQNNLLKQKKVYEKTSAGVYRVLADEQHFYYPYKPVYDLYGLYGPQIIPYHIATEWYLPDSTISTSYAYIGANQTSLQTTSKITYNDFYLQARSRSINSKGQIIDNKTWYPTDYNNVSGYNISALYNKHIWAIPIKQEVAVNGKIRSGSINKYSEYGQPLDGYTYENAVLSDTVAHSRNTVLETNYNLKASLRYDAIGNLKQINNYKGGPTTYIWDFQSHPGLGPINFLPVAMVQNADSTSVAYTSFEEGGTGNWNLTGSIVTDATAPTGTKCYSFGGGITKTGLNSGTSYTVSYWSKSSSYTVTGTVTTVQGKTLNGWTYFEHTVTGITSLTISGSGYIDELRLYPKAALMKSFVYKYGVGIASECNENSQITYYEYDNLGRLAIVRDDNKNILKTVCYNYGGQPVSCGFGTTAAWSAMSNSCEQSGGNNTGNMVIVEKDMNPSSATYNQTRNITIKNPGACPLCTPSNCSGVDKKCINDVCITAIKVYTSAILFHGQWKCTYHYLWEADCSVSGNYNETLSSAPTLNGGSCN
jgi:hypothetical protein